MESRSTAASAIASRVMQSKSLLAEAWSLFVEFSQKSTIHGVIYFGDRKRHWIERTWWIIAFILSIYSCALLIRNMYAKWDESPIILSFATTPTSVWEIPFPAVTICPETKTNKTQFNFNYAYDQLQSEAEDSFFLMMLGIIPDLNLIEQVGTLFQLCSWFVRNSKFMGMERMEYDSVRDIIMNMAPTHRSTLMKCGWAGKWLDNCAEWQTILTEDGVCFTFNMLNSKDIYRDEISDHFHSQVGREVPAPEWSPEGGFNKELKTFTYPHRSYRFGVHTALSIILRLYQEDLDNNCQRPFDGYKLLLHAPNEPPNFLRHFQNIRISLDTFGMVGVIPEVMTTSEGLRDYDAQRRQCYYNYERHLRYFKAYTQSNCELECLSNITLARCGCVRFSMPRNRDTPICGIIKMECFYNATVEFSEPFIENTAGGLLRNCDCLPACNSLTYAAEVTATELDWAQVQKAENILTSNLEEFSGAMNVSRLSVFFHRNSFIAFGRSELFGRTEFLANCGGLLALFIGVSILSIVEIVYFFTVRICFKLRARQKRNASLESDGSAHYRAE